MKKLPASESGTRVCCLTKGKQQYIVSHAPMTGKFTLWLIKDKEYEKIATAKSPLPLYDKIPWDK